MDVKFIFMSKIKLGAICLLAIALFSIPVLADYIDTMTFTSDHGSSLIAVETIDRNYTEFYMSSVGGISGIPIWVEITYTENGPSVYAHEGGGGGHVNSCITIEDEAIVCREDLGDHSMYINVTSMTTRDVVEFWIDDEIKDGHYYFEIEALGGIVEAPETDFITNNGTKVARVKLLKD